MQKQQITSAIGPKIIEGKTKIVSEFTSDHKKVIVQSKDDITAFNKAKHDIIEGKSKLATNTTCNVFRFLKECGLPVAFDEQIDEITFIAPRCDMILYEVIIRREAHGSFLKRYPYLKKGHVFPELVLEYFLKTSDNVWNGESIPCDDPYMLEVEGKAHLYLPNKPVWDQEPFKVLDDYPLKGRPEIIK